MVEIQGNKFIIELSKEQAKLLTENPFLTESFANVLDKAIKDFFKEF